MTGVYDPGVLRSGLRKVRFGRVFRVMHRDHRSTPLAASPAPSRFTDPHGRFAVPYASDTARCSFWETPGRNRFARRRRRELPRTEVEVRLEVSICCIAPLAMVDLRCNGPVRIGAPSAVAHDGNHVAGRVLSAAVHAGVPEADGFLFPSRFTATPVWPCGRVRAGLRQVGGARNRRPGLPHRVSGRPRRLRHRADGTVAGAAMKRRELSVGVRCSRPGLAAKMLWDSACGFLRSRATPACSTRVAVLPALID